MGKILDLQFYRYGFYMKLFLTFGCGVTIRDGSVTLGITIWKLNTYLSFSIEE